MQKNEYNYTTLAAKVSSTTITSKAVDKTQVREVSEKSLQSKVSYLITCATTLFQIGEISISNNSDINVDGTARKTDLDCFS